MNKGEERKKLLAAFGHKKFPWGDQQYKNFLPWGKGNKIFGAVGGVGWQYLLYPRPSIELEEGYFSKRIFLGGGSCINQRNQGETKGEYSPLIHV